MIDTALSSTAPALPARTTDSVLSRRVIAWLIDAVFLTVLLAVLHVAVLIVGLLTLGAGWTLWPILPVVPFIYAWAFLASAQAATPGQRLMGVCVVEHLTNRRPTTLEALISTALFTISLAIAPILLVALVSRRHRTLHDLVSGLVVIHADPLTLTAGGWNMSPSRSS